MPGSSFIGSGQSARSTSSYLRLVDAWAIATTHEAIFGHSRPARVLPIITKTVSPDFECEADVCTIHGLIASGWEACKACIVHTIPTGWRGRCSIWQAC